MNTQALRLLDFAIKTSKEGNHVFFNYSGHVHNVTIFAYVGEWNIFKDTILHYSISIEDLDDKYVDRIINKIEEEIKP